MEKNLITQAERFLLTRHKDKRRTWLLRVLAVAVAFATIYVLIFPAITMSNEVECGMVEHVHTEACWQEQLTPPQPQLTCPFQGTGAMVLHTHDSFCYNQQGELICTLEERAAHTHGAECYREHRELICTQAPDPGHTHTAACYAQDRGGELICGLEESGQGHTHTQECYPLERMDEPQCGLEESEDVVDEATGEVTASGHHHTAQCWEKRVDRKLVCGLEESEDVVDEATGEVLLPGHHHSAECWLTGDELCYQYGCGQHESQGHTHSDSCYAWTPRLICQEEERPAGHVHTDECYEITQLFVCLEPEIVPHTHEAGCYDENGVLVCQLPEVVAHQHTAECFTTPEGEAEPVRTLICGMEEHQHTEECYVRVEKDEGPTFYCGLEEHVHTMPDCFFETGTLRCTLTEHVHDLTCLEPPVEASDDPEQSQDPAESEEPEPSESQEPEQTVVEGVELVDAQFSDVYSTAEFTMSFYVNGFAQVAEEHGQDQSQDQEPLRLPDPMPTHSGEEFMELVENMVPLAAMPRMTAYAAPMSSGMEGVDPPAMVQTDSVTTPGSDIEPEGTAVDNSSQVILNDPLLPENHTEGGQQASESLPASVEPTPETGLPSAEPTPEADDSSAQPERVLLDPSQVRFVVEPLEDGGDEWETALAAAAELGEEEQAMVLQMFTVAAYAGDGRKLDMAGWDMEAEVVFSDELLDYAESAGEEQLSTIETDGESGEESAQDMGTVISVLDLETSEEMAYASVSSVRASARSLRFAVKASRGGDSKMGLMLIKNVYPHFDVQYYAYVKQPKSEGATRLSFIDTSAKANEDRATLPKNDGTTPKIKEIGLDEKGNVLFDDGVLQQIYLPKTQQFNPLEDELTVDGLMKMSDEGNTGLSHYDLKELWALKEGFTAEEAAADEEHSDLYWHKYPDWQNLSFTNNPAAEVKEGEHPVLLIQENETTKTVFRMVYDQKVRENEDKAATFYDYDITEGVIPEGKDKGKVNVDKQGINSYKKDEGLENVLGFGNGPSVIKTGLGANKGADKSYINQATNAEHYVEGTVGYSGCSFGLVSSRKGENDVNFGNGVDGPSLFGSEAVKGKRALSGYSLEFMGEGDTYTMTAVKKDKKAVLSDLHKLGHTRPNWNNTRMLYSNEFWPLDGDPGEDPLFGEKIEGTDHTKYLTTEGQYLPASDYNEDHNAYFGMHFAIQFTLPKDYTGPLEYYFYGDDDMWVFMNDDLVCDIGGVHGSVGEYVDLWDYLGVKRYEERLKTITKTLYFFYTERGASGSTCWMQYTLPNAVSVDPIAPPGEGPSLTIEKEVAGNMATEADMNRFYTFNLDLTGLGNGVFGGKLYNEKDQLVQVTHSEKDGRLVYTSTGEPDNNPDSSKPDYTNISVSGPICFPLKDGWKLVLQDLPAGASYAVEEVFPKNGEPKPDGCQVSFSQDGAEAEAGYKANDWSIKADGSKVKFINSFGYELPETGGAGSWYTMACVPLLAAGCLWYKKKSQGEGAADDV